MHKLAHILLALWGSDFITFFNKELMIWAASIDTTNFSKLNFEMSHCMSQNIVKHLCAVKDFRWA